MDAAPVLIVDDDPATCRAVGNALKLEGFEVLTAEDGQAGLDLALQRGVSLILLDIGMPVMDGLEFLRRYQAAGVRQAPVVILSGLVEEQRWRDAQAVVDSLPKPFELDELIQLVSRHVTLPSAERHPGAEQDVVAADLLGKVAAERNPDSLAQLYEMFAPAGFAICLHVNRDRMWAEDTLQEAFLNIWRKAGQFDPAKGGAKRWLLTVIYHQAIDRLRRGRNFELMSAPPWMPEPDSQAPDVWHDVERNLQHEVIVGALRLLPVEQRQVIQLAYFGGFTHAEVSRLLGIPLGTVKGRLRLAMDKLRLSLAVSVGAPGLN